MKPILVLLVCIAFASCGGPKEFETRSQVLEVYCDSGNYKAILESGDIIPVTKKAKIGDTIEYTITLKIDKP